MAKSLTFELSEEQAEFLHATAEREQRSVDEVMGDLVRRQMDYDAWFIRQVQIGIDEADRGELTPHEEVMAEMQRRRAAYVREKAG
jgi:predicted transcriptional regulator